MKKKDLLLIAAALLIIVVSGCKRDNFSNGYLRIQVTDDPFPVEFIEEATVQIIKVEARLKDYDEGYPFITLLEDTLELNLLDLRNGVTAELAEMEVPAGEYDLIRLYVESAGITIKDHGSYDMKVPSGAQTGIKIFVDPPITVEGGLTSDLLLDFNLDKSFILKGNISTPAGIKGFNFKPVIRAVNINNFGYGLRNCYRYKRCSYPCCRGLDNGRYYNNYCIFRFNGYYALPGISEGTYSLFAAKENYDTLSIDNIKVTAANRNRVDIELVPKN